MSWRQCKHWGFLGWRLVIAWYIFLHNIQENAFVTHFGWAEQGHIEPQLLCCTIQKSCVVQQQLNQLPLKQSCYVDSLRIDNSLWDGSIERGEEGARGICLPPSMFVLLSCVSNLTTSSVPNNARDLNYWAFHFDNYFTLQDIIDELTRAIFCFTLRCYYYLHSAPTFGWPTPAGLQLQLRQLFWRNFFKI